MHLGMVVEQSSYRRLASDGVLGLEWVWQECRKCSSLGASEVACPNQESSHYLFFHFVQLGIVTQGSY